MRVFFGLLAALTALAVGAEELRFDSAAQWAGWSIPGGAVEVRPDGWLQPVRFGRDIDAVANAEDFGGGVRRAGSGAETAALALDGDVATGWSPDWGGDPDDWFIEVDLGRGVSARAVRLLFAEDSPAFELFDLLLSTGEPAVDRVGNVVEGSLIYRTRERFRENTRRTVVYAPESLFNTPVEVLRLQVLKAAPGARLVGVEVETEGDNMVVNLVERGGRLEVAHNVTHAREEVSLGNAKSLVDGSIFQGWSNRSEPRAVHDVWSTITMDLGAVYEVDFVRLIGGVGRARRFNFKNYEVLSADGALAPDGTLIWTKHFAGRGSDANRQVGLADHVFPPLPARFVRVAWQIWDAACAEFFGGEGSSTQWVCFASGSTDEIQVFGEGYPLEARLRSPLIDLGSARSLNRVSWQGDTPPGTRIEVRSRSGRDVVERFSFYDRNGKELSERAWNRLIPGFRGPVDTTRVAGADWSPWSTGYAAGDEAFLSPSPRRYAELEVRLVSQDPAVAPRLDWVSLDHSPPLASTAFGEISPLQAVPGAVTEFAYFMRSGPSPGGFDRVAIEASATPRFLGALLEGEPVEVVEERIDQGFRVTFPRRVQGGELVEVRFVAEVFVPSTRFDAFLEDSRQTMRQPVDAGNADTNVEGDRVVVSLPVGGPLLHNVDWGGGVLTPNGDGANDVLVLRLDLSDVLEPRPLHLRLYDLAGALVWQRREARQAGRLSLEWDGRAGGRLLPPGLYVAELSLEGDAREQAVRRIVRLAY